MDVEYGLRTERNLPVDSSKTGLPDVNITPPTKRASQFETPFKNLHLAARLAERLAFILLTLSGMASDSKPVLSQNMASHSSKTGENNLVLENTPLSEKAFQNLPAYPNTQPSGNSNGESRVETLNLTASEVFGNNVTTAEKLRAAPDKILDFKLVTDPQNNVSEFVILKETKKGKFVYRVMLDPQKGTFRDAFQTTRTPLSFEAESVVKVGTRTVVGGQTEWVSGIPVLLRSIDSVRPFEPVSVSSTTLWRVAEMNQVPNTSKVILTGGPSLVIADLDSGKIVETSGKSGGLGVTITSESADNQTVAVYSINGNYGLLRESLNLSTGQIQDSKLYFSSVDVNGYSFIKDANGNVEKILTTIGVDDTFRILDVKTNSTKIIPYAGWINHLEIPNMRKNSLVVGPIATTSTDRVWAVGSYSDGDGGRKGGNGMVILSWPLFSDPNTEPRVMTVYQLLKGRSAGVTQQSLKSGVFSGKNGFLINFQEFGLVFIETKQDGSPIEGTIPIYLSIRDQAAPTANIPVILNSIRN